MPYIIGEQKLFPSVDSVDSVLTEEFLEAARGAVQIVASMGAQFSMTKDDMLGNIKKIEEKYVTDKEKYRKFKDILQDEKDNNVDKKDKSATVGGLWLKRGLEYLCEVFWELILEHEGCKKSGTKSSSSAVSTACKAAYEKSLKIHHNFATKLIVKTGLMASPYKETLMTNLAKGEKDKDDEIEEEMKRYEAPFRTYVIILGKIFREFGYDDKSCLEDIHGTTQQAQ